MPDINVLKIVMKVLTAMQGLEVPQPVKVVKICADSVLENRRIHET